MTRCFDLSFPGILFFVVIYATLSSLRDVICVSRFCCISSNKSTFFSLDVSFAFSAALFSFDPAKKRKKNLNRCLCLVTLGSERLRCGVVC